MTAISRDTSNGTDPGSRSSSPSPSPPSRSHSSSPIPNPSFIPPVITPLGWKGEQVVRLMLQELETLGFRHSASMLSRETGLYSEDRVVHRLRGAIGQGAWDEAEAHVDHLGLQGEDREDALFIIRRQKFLEALEAGRAKEALYVLRTELSELHLKSTEDRSKALLHQLSGLIMCTSPEEVRSRGQWSGVRGDSRAQVLRDLQKYIPPGRMLPELRLETLLDQAMRYQRSMCRFHNTLEFPRDLYTDHSCTPEDVPRHTVKILREHTDEVWFIAYSPSGKYLASTSKDGTCIIWETRTWTSLYILAQHSDVVCGCVWSPDEQRLLTCGNDRQVIMWSIAGGGKVERSFVKHNEPVTACAWLPDGKSFVSASLDHYIHLWSALDGTILHTWQMERVNDVHISGNGKWMAATTVEKTIHLIDLEKRTDSFTLPEVGMPTGCRLNWKGSLLLVNSYNGPLHLWDLEHRSIVERYSGHLQDKYVIRGGFGGAQENFIVSGSEDFDVYIWLRKGGELIERLKGHDGVVNVVAWNPHNPQELASASDDRTIRIWRARGDESEVTGANGMGCP
ncbi:MAG: WD40-repeat-containing domain protein [Piptocephalis tieghemiana]|nr:MAG: WD40-repeat-containing domain protein [Piptocephalis tieghemiana]